MSDPRITAVKSVLDRLLHDEDTRSRFLSGGAQALDLDDETARAFGSVDRDQLESTARKIMSDLLTRKHRGSPGLLETFAETLRGVDVRESLLPRFVASEHYAAYRELDGTAGDDDDGRGLCIEEAFARHLEEADVGEPSVRRREYLHALFRALALQPKPRFRVPDEVRRTGDGGYLLVDETPEGPRLYAIARGRLMLGPLTPLLARVLETDGTPRPDEVTDERAWSACVERLRAMGLLARPHPAAAVGAS